MTELVLKGLYDPKKLEAIINFLKSWDIEVEVRTKEKKAEKKFLFENSFGMWENHDDIDIKNIRQKNRNRRTESYG